MKEGKYFYGMEGEEPGGPLELAAIRAAVGAGRLSPAVQIARDMTGPWYPLMEGREMPPVTKLKAPATKPLCFALDCLAWAGFIAAGFIFITVICSLGAPTRQAAVPTMIVSALTLAGVAISLIWMSTVISLLSKISEKE